MKPISRSHENSTECEDTISRRFVELLTEYHDPELCPYKEYKGKPYFSIKYIENGEYIGYGTYNPKVLSQYLKEYFISSAQPNLQPTCNQLATDAISRQAAIEATYEEPTYTDPINVLTEVRDRIKALPSAQPEIIRCKDCEYGEQDEVGRWFCRSLGCKIGNEDGSGFCADAERRTDE